MNVVWQEKKKQIHNSSKGQVQNCPALLGSHCRRRTMDGSLLAPRMNSSRESFPRKETRLLSTRGGLQHTCQASGQARWKEAGEARTIPGKATLQGEVLPACTLLALQVVPRVWDTPATPPGGCLPSRLVSIWRKIFSVLFSGVDSSSGIFITEETIL